MSEQIRSMRGVQSEQAVMPSRKRVTFHAPPHDHETANLWVDVAVSDGITTFTLLHDYPDFAPRPGWHIHHDGAEYEITAVDGRTLNCVPVN